MQCCSVAAGWADGVKMCDTWEWRWEWSDGASLTTGTLSCGPTLTHLTPPRSGAGCLESSNHPLVHLATLNSIVIPNIQLKLSDSKSPSLVTYLNCHHLTVRTRLLSTNKASNELWHPAPGLQAPVPDADQVQDDLELLPLTRSETEKSPELPAVVGEIQKKLDQSIVWREKHLCQILFEFYHGQTFDDEVKKTWRWRIFANSR